MMGWVIFAVVIAVMLSLDFFVFQRKDKSITFFEAALWSIFWVAVSLAFCVYIYAARGKEDALNFLTGYLIEKSLSIDNLFVFLIIFNYFNTPKKSYHTVLYWGVLGALIMRALLIAGGLTLITRFHWVIYLLGCFLIYTGIKFWLGKDKKTDPERNVILKFFRTFFSVDSNYHGDRFFIKKGTRNIATVLFIVLLSIETTDLVFAIDSIPAILAITYDPFIVYTSNIFALLGLRTLFFVLAELMHLFHYLHYALACILVLIGFKMLLSAWIALPIILVLGGVMAILISSILLSLWRTQ
jgi:tellurite resistance protein TerC